MATELAVVSSVDPDNLVEGDLKLVNGQLVLIEGDSAITQHIRARLQFFKGEWFLDLREGVPYFEQAFVKSPNIDVLRNIFRTVITETPGVESAPQVELEIDTLSRKLTVSFIVVLDTGVVLTSADFIPFVVEV